MPETTVIHIAFIAVALLVGVIVGWIFRGSRSVGEKTAYLAEVAQAGIFLISGFNEQARHAVMNTMCPNTLFPYARRSISDLVGDGGFPALTLQPVNFEQLYAQRMQELAQEQGSDQAGESGNGEAVAAEFSTDD